MESSPSQVVLREGTERILMTDETHIQLFNHDEEIIRRSHEELAAAQRDIVILEERLREVTEKYNFTLIQLNESGIDRFNVTQSRLTLERHLHLEIHLHQTQAQAYHSLDLQYKKTLAELDAMKTLNEMWSQEVERDRRVIKSMAEKLSDHENEALRLSGSWRGSSHAQRQDTMVEINAPTYESSPMLSAGSSIFEMTLESPASDKTFIDDSPQISITRLSPPGRRELRSMATVE